MDDRSSIIFFEFFQAFFDKLAIVLDFIFWLAFNENVRVQHSIGCGFKEEWNRYSFVIVHENPMPCSLVRTVC